MAQNKKIIPQSTVPELSFHLTSGETWKLADQDPEKFTLLIFYRGLHCPVCKSYTQTLDNTLSNFESNGISVVTVSMDSKERADKSVEDWGLDNLDVGYGLTEKQAREWGLFLSKGIKDEEPDLFSEPGLFLVRPDGELYYSAVNSMPFGRPDLKALLSSVKYLSKQDYPARGEVE